jgi:hypothetical protein
MAIPKSTVNAEPGTANSSNLHKPQAAHRGFVPRGLSYAKRRPIPNPVSISSNAIWYETGLADHVIEHLDREGTSDLSPQHRRVALLRVMTRSFRPSFSSESDSSFQPQSLKSVPPEWEGDEGQYCPDPDHQRDQRRIQAVLDRNDGSADLRCHSRFEERDLCDWSA